MRKIALVKLESQKYYRDDWDDYDNTVIAKSLTEWKEVSEDEYWTLSRYSHTGNYRIVEYVSPGDFDSILKDAKENEENEKLKKIEQDQKAEQKRIKAQQKQEKRLKELQEKEKEERIKNLQKIKEELQKEGLL